MKKLFPFLAIAGMFAVQSCEGPAGPPGPAGYTAESEVFEVSTSFSSITNYSQTYPLNPDIRPEDNILVYELYNVQDNIDTWALLPQVYYFPQGTAQYNYNFSYDQFTLLIDASFDRALLPTNFTQNKIFRIVVIPGYFSKQDFHKMDYVEVVQMLGLEGKPIKRISIQ